MNARHRGTLLGVLLLIAGCGQPSGESAVASETPVLTPGPLDSVRLTKTQRTTLTALAADLERYGDMSVAEADGYRLAQACVAGAGSHWMNDELVEDPAVEPSTPEALMYDGDGELVGVEYFVYATHPRPDLFGRLMDGPFTVRGILPEQIWWRHVWLYRWSPEGVFSLTNSNVSC